MDHVRTSGTAFAGLYETWVDKEAPGEAASYRSCAIITMDASESVKAVPNRMPMILEPRATPSGWIRRSKRLPK